MAPEVIRQSKYDETADIWSIGITAIEIIRGSPPLGNVHPVKALFAIPKNSPPRLKEGEGGDGGMDDFVEKCLQMEPGDRWDAARLLEHRFIKGAGEKGRLAAGGAQGGSGVAPGPPREEEAR